jgi:hypothetical protein
MKTFGDFIKFFSSAKVCMDLCECERGEIREDFHERSKAIGLEICRENNISQAQIGELPWETVLGEKSRALAESLRNWFNLEAADKR